MRVLVAMTLVALLSGCSAPATPDGSPEPPLEDSPPAKRCTPADTNNYGTRINDVYVAQDGEVWRETNGIPNLQRSATCEGPADERVA